MSTCATPNLAGFTSTIDDLVSIKAPKTLKNAIELCLKSITKLSGEFELLALRNKK